MHKDIRRVGVNDRTLDLFEGQYFVPNGMTYHSYVILDEKIAVLDTVSALFGEPWLENVRGALCGRTPDYLIVQHMEPDHSANLMLFCQTYPEAQVVATAQAFRMMEQFFGRDFVAARVLVKDGDTLCLGAHTLRFVTAPMVHWPEVMMTYDALSETLFSADAFGKFGTEDTEEDWACEARRYYFGIVGKYGAQVQALFAKLAGLPVSVICPLHGVVLEENLEYYLGLYQTWSSYEPEQEGIFIAYTSVYGHTKAAALYLAEQLAALGANTVSLCDLARSDRAEAVEDAFRYSTLVLATTTYNMDIFPFMRDFLLDLTERGYQKRTVAMIENGSWAPAAARVMRAHLAECRDLRVVEPVVTVKSAMTDENREQLRTLADTLVGKK